MQYVLKQKLVSLGNNFTIRTVDGSDAYLVKGEVASLGDKLSLQDLDGNELLDIEQKVFNWVGTYELRRDGRLLAEVRRDFFSFWRRRFIVDAGGPGDLEAVGDILSFEYVVRRGDRKVATLTRQWFRLSDTYWVQIDEEEKDPILVLGLAVVIEVVCRRRHNY